MKEPSIYERMKQELATYKIPSSPYGTYVDHYSFIRPREVPNSTELAQHLENVVTILRTTICQLEALDKKISKLET